MIVEHQKISKDNPEGITPTGFEIQSRICNSLLVMQNNRIKNLMK